MNGRRHDDEDRALGMDRPVTRRDFLNGVAVPVAGAALGLGGGTAHAAAPAPPAASAASAASPSMPMPMPIPGGATAASPIGASLAAVAGQTLQAAAPMHARRDGAPRPQPPAWTDADERADLVVVGAGISGLAAAFLYRQQRPRARVLVLDALPMIGGHAQRNEFVASNGRRLIGYGGSEAMDSPSLWSPAARSLVEAVGIELAPFKDWFDAKYGERHGLDQRAAWYPPDAWSGTGGLVRHGSDEKPAQWVPRLPLPPAVQRDYLALLEGPPDPFPTLTRSQKREKLAAITYDQLLIDTWLLQPDVARLLNGRTRGYLGVGTDAASALDAWALGLPGFAKLDLGEGADRLMSPSGRQVAATPDDYIYHFPDGNHGIVRALVRQLVPDALPGTGAESLVLASLDTSKLDLPGTPCRIRVSSPVIDVRHAGDPAHASAVDVAYVGADGTTRTVRAGQVVLACFHRVIPFLCPELPAKQVAALDDQCKVPLIYGTVMLRNWRAFAAARIEGFSLPGHALWDEIRLDMPVSIGRYRFPESPDDPVLLHMSAVVLDGPEGTSEREQCAAGRRRLYAMDFDAVERDLRRTLNGALGAFGFDAARDIEAITLNRWAHGYAYEYMRPWDAYWPDGPLPIDTARRGWGRIAIANADAGAYAYAHGAIDQATRAVAELLPHAKLPAGWTTPGPSPKALKLAAR
jgi:spermidine dehydrogenase